LLVHRLFLLRHAKSSWKDPGQADDDRPLAGRGRRAAKALARSPRSAEPMLATITQRVSRLWRRRSGGRRSSDRSPEVGWEQRVETLEARVQHLEAELEGLQDAVYRRAVLEDEHIDELRTRTAPEQLARDLSQDARKRGL
jgi:hypothetical protein